MKRFSAAWLSFLGLLAACVGSPDGPGAGGTTSDIGSTGDESSEVSSTESSAGPGDASSSTTAAPGGAVRELIDEAVESGFEGAILVRLDGEVLVVEGHGLAARQLERENTPQTAYDFGSVMKDFTAAAIFALEEDDALSTTDSLDVLLPGIPPDKAQITVLQVLQHRAGFGEYHDTLGDFEPMDRMQARAAILGQTLLFEPGSEEAYSNAGFTLLADIVETTSGQPFADYVRERLLEPAGMEATGFFGEALWAEHPTAVGYDALVFEGNDPATWPYTWALVGNGGLVTTVEDLDRWLIELWAGNVLEPAAFDAYAAGYLRSTDVGGQDVFGYAGGGDFGFGGVALDVPAINSRVVIGTNTAENFDIESFSTALGLAMLEG
ncbi:MAG: serine hydrolase domain-containing protein [Nannocystales bacterium]